MRVLVVGSGGREHALVEALAAGGAEVHATRPNPGMARHAHAVDASPDDVGGIVAAAVRLGVGLVVVGPEAPLVAGIGNALRAAGIPCLGPDADGARLEGSKAFAKAFLDRHAIATARYRNCGSPAEALRALREFGAPIVVKADGLAGGKGVVVAECVADAEAAIASLQVERRLGSAGDVLVLEERLQGPELTVMALCDGERLLVLDTCRDFKRIGEGDCGDNTGGMGAVCPVPLAADLMARIDTDILQPTLRGLVRDGVHFRGVLYAGLMLTADGPKVLEYNVRFGDPEAQVLLPRLGGAFVDLALAAATGRLPAQAPAYDRRAAVTVVLAAAGYPAAPRIGDAIYGVEAAAAEADVHVFHAGTRNDGDGNQRAGTLRTSGGRVLAVTGLGATIASARAAAYRGVGRIRFDGMQVRPDIGRSLAT